MLNFFKGIVEHIEVMTKENGGFTEKKIYIVPLNISDSTGEINAGHIEAFPPNVLPTSMTGSGTVSYPMLGQHVLAVKDDKDSKAYIISYLKNNRESPFGHYEPEELIEGATVLKIGGVVKSVFTLAPQGFMSLESNPEFSSFRIFGDRFLVTLGTKEFYHNYEAGIYKNFYYKDNHPTEKFNVTGHVETYTRFSETRTLSDRETCLAESVPTIPLPLPYEEKIVIRAGNIWNLGERGEDSIRTHLYEIDTRQSTVNNLTKDTVNVERTGYQKEHKDYGNIRAAGTMWEKMSKRNDATPVAGKYSTFFNRYGQLEGQSDLEATEGEVYRVQIYHNVYAPIGIPIIDPVGKGKGYAFKFQNDDAAEEYLESYGVLKNPDTSRLKNSFYRKHYHYYTDHSVTVTSIPTGHFYSENFGGTDDDGKKAFFATNHVYEEKGEVKIRIDTTFLDEEGGTFFIKKTNNVSLEEQEIQEFKTHNKYMLGSITSQKSGDKSIVTMYEFTDEMIVMGRTDTTGSSEVHEKIITSKDNLEIDVIPDDTTKYNIKMGNQKIIITMQGEETSTITMEPTMITIVAPEEVIVNTKKATVNAEDEVIVNTKVVTVNASDLVEVNEGNVHVMGGDVLVDGGKVTITSVIPGGTPGFCAQLLCPVTNIPLTGPVGGG